MAAASNDILLLAAAVGLAALGGVSFFKGLLGIAAWLRLPNMLVATTLAAFATSGPEMAVSTLAALSGQPEIGLGDALGSNVLNLGLILGVALLFGPMKADCAEWRRDIALALLVPALTMVLMQDGYLSRAEGMLLLALFALWMVLVVRQGASVRRAAPAGAGVPVLSAAGAWLHLLVGLPVLMLAGQLFVAGASGIAIALGVHPYTIGATIVAIGTSLPELVTVLLSRMRGHDDVGLGTLLGSNLFNGLAIVGVAATLHPIAVPRSQAYLALAFGVVMVLLILSRGGAIARFRGIALLGAYGAFVGLSARAVL